MGIAKPKDLEARKLLKGFGRFWQKYLQRETSVCKLRSCGIEAVFDAPENLQEGTEAAIPRSCSRQMLFSHES